ncbi:MAG: signal peptidase I [Bacilli bacterium]|nr:signal peptidase I [Bacilli bacterium]
MKEKNKGIVKKIINITLDVFIVMLGVILLITVYNNVQVKILGHDYASFFGHSVFEVQTGSMGEIIEPGDWIVVKYEKNIKLNDIVTFEHKGEYITHRVIEAYNGTYVTKGDANTAKDAPISKEQIVGKVVKVIPNFGILRKTIFNPIVLVAIIITLFFLNQVFKKTTKEDIEKEKALKAKLRRALKLDTPEESKEKIEKVQLEKEETKKEEPKEEIREVKEEKVELTKEQKEKVKAELENTSDIEKTLFFRMVSVDKDELSNVYEEIPKEIEEQSEKAKENIKEGEKEEVEVSEDKIKSKLELIQRKKKKCKNIIEKAMLIKKEEIIELMTLLNKGEELKTNEPTIREKLVTAYIDAKYYNNCGNINLAYNGKNMLTKVDSLIEKVGENLTNSYKESDTKYAEKVEKNVKFMLLINHLEEDFKLEDLQKKKETYNKRILKYIKFNDLSQQDIKKLITNIMKTQKTYSGMIKFIQSKINTNMFELKFNKLTRKDMYAVELTHNIQFSKVYSDYIVDKTYSEGIIAEDKVKVLGNLLLSQMVNDMLNGEFNKKYFVYIPESIYAKDNKLDQVFDMLDDDFAKKNINIILAYNGLSDNKKVIKQLIKQGFNFSLDMNDVELLKKSDIKELYVLEHIFISRKKVAKTNIIDVLPEEVKPKILYEEISSKIGNF